MRRFFRYFGIEQQTRSRHRAFGRFLGIPVAATVVILPMLLWGSPRPRDLDFHLPLWIDVATQWTHGVLYPHWAEQAQFGFGQPIPTFYPPLSWLLGAALVVLLPIDAVTGAYVWLVLTISGFTMFHLVRTWFDVRIAFIAAMLYVSNPYNALRIYHQGSFAELMVSAALPLLFLYLLRLNEDSSHATAMLGAVFGAIWLMNPPGAIIVTYLLVAAIVTLAAYTREWNVVLRGMGAVALGFGMAAFYLVPVWRQQNWISLSSALPEYLLPYENFLPAWEHDPGVGWFYPMLSASASWFVVTLVAAAWFQRDRFPKRYLTTMVFCAAVSTAMLLPISASVYAHLPRLEFVQFPWRWLLIVAVTYAGFLAVLTFAAPRFLRTFIVACLVATFPIGIALSVPSYRGLAAWKQDTTAMHGGYYGRPEYMVAGTELDSVWEHQAMRTVELSIGERPRIQISAWEPDHKEFRVRMEEAGTVSVRLMNYPSWQVRVNGLIAGSSTEDETGRMQVLLPEGESTVEIRWRNGWDVWTGLAISVFSLLLLLWLRFRTLSGASPRPD